MQKPSWIVLAVLMSALAAGCGVSPPPMVEVSGILTLDGKPLDRVRVELWPLDDGPQSAALTDADGRFEMTTLDGKTKGAMCGRHRVVLHDVSIYKLPFKGRESANVDLTEGQKPRTASEYTNVTRTPLEIEIPEVDCDIELSVQPYAG